MEGTVPVLPLTARALGAMITYYFLRSYRIQESRSSGGFSNLIYFHGYGVNLIRSCTFSQCLIKRKL
jgi:hypothetical protein